MTSNSNTDYLLERAAGGESDAQIELIDGQRESFKRMICIRMNPRLSTHLDASDVV